MIIETRYRDIDFEQVMECFRSHMDTPSNRQKWRRWRGQAITIQAPATTEEQWAHFKCSGPHFRVMTPQVGRNSGVCPHIAEIGD